MDTSDKFRGEVHCPPTLKKLLTRLRRLGARRKKRHEEHRAKKRRRNTPRGKAREKVLKATGKRCHICGGLIAKKWQADHVLAFSADGKDSSENYLPAHRLCNRYRWDYGSEEFQWILKIGIWARTLMRNSSLDRGKAQSITKRPKGGFGREMAERFFAYEKGSEKRRQKKPGGLAQ